VIGPFGLIPTRDGLTSSMKLVNSLTPVRVDSLISTIDEVIHEENLINWNNELDRINQHLIAWQRPIIPGFHYSEAFQPLGLRLLAWMKRNQGNVGPHFLVDPRNLSLVDKPGFIQLLSPIRVLLLGQLEKKFSDILHERPMKKIMFNGPIIMFNYYREGYMEEIVKYISSKVSTIVKPSVTFDPFEAPKTEIPRLLGKGDAFFMKVRERQLERTKVALANLEASLNRER